MLSQEDNQTLVRIGAGTPMGSLMRLYWLPFLHGRLSLRRTLLQLGPSREPTRSGGPGLFAGMGLSAQDRHGREVRFLSRHGRSGKTPRLHGNLPDKAQPDNADSFARRQFKAPHALHRNARQGAKSRLLAIHTGRKRRH